jgi:hypothetical protein
MPNKLDIAFWGTGNRKKTVQLILHDYLEGFPVW